MPTPPTLTRRAFAAGAAGAGLVAVFPWCSSAAAQDPIASSLVIDLDGELESIHPSLAYSGRDWSVVNSIYDSILTIDGTGSVVPLAAETFDTEDAKTFSVKMRSGVKFHDGTPLTAEVLRGSWQFLMESGSSVLDLFQVIEDITVDGDLDATIACSTPAPWLPAQIATWMMLVPPGYTEEAALSAPVGTGPYTLSSYSQGQDIELAKFEDYQLGGIKGAALAETVTFRIVPEAATRVADIVSGTSQIADHIPQDFRSEVEGQGATMLDDPLVGSQWIRIATDAKPFDDQRVRQALNYAVDKKTIVEALLGPGHHALGSIFPDERAPGYLESIEPYAYDADRARELLADAGVEEGAEVALEITQSARKDIAEVIAANLSDVGFAVEIVTSDLATFNSGWADAERPALRMSTWSPLYEPHTLLSLVFVSDGYLSRYSNEAVDELFAEASTEADPEARRQLLQNINSEMHDDPPVIFLWNLTASYAVSGDGEMWTPRGTDQIVPVTLPDGIA